MKRTAMAAVAALASVMSFVSPAAASTVCSTGATQLAVRWYGWGPSSTCSCPTGVRIGGYVQGKRDSNAQNVQTETIWAQAQWGDAGGQVWAQVQRQEFADPSTAHWIWAKNASTGAFFMDTPSLPNAAWGPLDTNWPNFPRPPLEWSGRYRAVCAR